MKAHPPGPLQARLAPCWALLSRRHCLLLRRWVHHTSLLWDYRDERMALLRQPGRQPEYRQARGARGAGRGAGD